MSMDNSPQMKPQDTTIFLLGELRGLMTGLQTTVASAAKSQADAVTENRREHEEFRKTLETHADEITAIKSAQPVRVSPWAKAGVIIAIPSSLIALVGFIVLYLQPHA
jgi:capsular polysaccharide biosynthesis protein